MKKSIKVLIAAAISSTLILGGTMLSGCFVTADYSGEYHYNAWGTEYGIKVSVEIQSDDKGDRIRKVEVLESDYVEVSAPHGDWTEENIANWNDNLNSLLLKYRGAYVMDILEEIVTCIDSAPTQVSDSDLVITGATQSSGRLMLAVQSALLSSLTDLGYTVLEGEYHYNAWGTEYGMKVNVFVKDNTIMGVRMIDSDYIEVSSANPDRGWTDSMVANWNNNLVSLLNAYNGKTVDEIKAITVTKDSEDKVPTAVSDEEYVISGATQGSGRLMLAVQDALSKL